MKNLILLVACLFIINLTAHSSETVGLKTFKSLPINETEMVESVATLQITAGQLSTRLTPEQLAGITSLTLTGTIDARDFKTMRDLMPVLANVDLSGADIVAYSGTEGSVIENINYPANSVPVSALNSKTSLKSVVLANSITSISFESFLSCSSLESVILPSTLISIDSRAFGWCNLSNILLPSTLQSIGNYAFANNNISMVNIPESVQSIGSGVFYQNRMLTEINVSPSNENYISIDGVLFNKDHSELIHYPNGKTNTHYSLPVGVKKIQARSFDGGNSNLRNLTIPEGVIEIGFWAFANLWNLESIDIPSSVTVISDGAFIGQHNNLQSIIIRKKLPVAISSDVFGDVDKSTCVLYVPFGTKPEYQAANVWKDFLNIVEMEPDEKLTFVPDDNFEQALIDLGYDFGPLDDYVPTANISGLTFLDISNKEISDLTGIQDFVSLHSLYCFSNNLTSLDLSKNTNLKILICGSNQISTLDVTENFELIQLSCDFNQLTVIDVSKNKALESLYLYNNKLSFIDLGQNTKLTNLSVAYNQLTTIDVSKNVELKQLGCEYNQLTDIDISCNTMIEILSIFNNNLTDIDVTNNNLLTVLNCQNNLLTSLDVGKNSNLTRLYCSNNLLTSLNVRNGNNFKMIGGFNGLNAQNNHNLFCIEVDDPAASEIYAEWFIDPHASYSTNCSSNPVVIYPSDADIVMNNGQTYNITWSDFSGGRVKIELMKGNAVVATIVASTPNDGSHLWTIPSGLESGDDFRIIITSIEDRSVSDISDNFFAIQTLANPLVLVPSEPGLIWNNNKTYNITWSGITGSKVRIELIKGHGVKSTIANSTANDGSHPWTIAKNLQAGNDYKIRVTSVENISVTDISDFDFTIQPATDNPGKKSAEIEIGLAHSQEKSFTIFPNPFSNKVYFEVSLKEPAKVVLEIFTVTGLKLSTLFDGNVEAGVQTRFEYNPEKIPAQVLIYRLRIGDELETGKLIYKP